MTCYRCSKLDEDLQKATVPFLEHEKIVEICLRQNTIIEMLFQSIQVSQNQIERLILVLENRDDDGEY